MNILHSLTILIFFNLRCSDLEKRGGGGHLGLAGAISEIIYPYDF